MNNLEKEAVFAVLLTCLLLRLNLYLRLFFELSDDFDTIYIPFFWVLHIYIYIYICLFMNYIYKEKKTMNRTMFAL